MTTAVRPLYVLPPMSWVDDPADVAPDGVYHRPDGTRPGRTRCHQCTDGWLHTVVECAADRCRGHYCTDCYPAILPIPLTATAA